MSFDLPEAEGPLVAQPERRSRDDTLARVRDRGVLLCGINGQSHGLSLIGEDGRVRGMEADLVHALAAAVLGDRDRVQFHEVSASDRFDRVLGPSILVEPQLDIVYRNTTVTTRRDASKHLGGRGVNFGPTYFHDGRGILVDTSALPPNIRIDSDSTIADLPNGAEICPLSDLLPIPSLQAALQAASAAGCLAVITDRSLLASIKATGDPANNWVLLKQTLTKEPLAPIIADGDDVWSAIVSWCFYALVFAEEQGITSDNIDVNAQDGIFGTDNSHVTGVPLGLGGPSWAGRMIEQVGNYGQIYAANLDQFGLERDGTPNALWANEGGGLIYSPPIR